MSSIKNQRIESFLKDLSSPSPTPGGGAVAALSGAMAASLVEMVCNLTLGKMKYQKASGQARRIKSEASKIRKQLTDLSDKDVSSFNSVLAAYKSKDKKRIKTALLGATSVPQEVKKLSARVGQLATSIGKVGNRNAYSDARSAFYLAFASQKAAEENIKINKKALAALN